MGDVLATLSGALVQSMVLMPVCLVIIGKLLKLTPGVKTWMIPWILSAIGVLAGLLVTYESGADTGAWLVQGIVQGVIATGMSQLSYQLYAQTKYRAAS
ncbi:MAG: phage holin family protein [Christensenellaceae bacterium]|jgi:hypothetical protein|nr:phage holin family protein [Christensenellaceae bacterium]